MPSRPGVLLQARLASTRLPGKALELIDNRPLLEHCLRRLMAAGHECVVRDVSPTRERACDPRRLGIAKTAERHDARPHGRRRRGVRSRPVIRATGDNPAVDIDAAGRSLAALNGLHADYVARTAVCGAAEGDRAGRAPRARPAIPTTAST
jgi:spore coat polysaccharide biosynthesis protein SpsF